MKSKLYILLTILLACTMQVKGITVNSTESTTLWVGNSNSTYNGLSPANNYAASQTLYTAEEIGRGGLISQISFRVKVAATSAISGSVKIYLAETDQTTLTTSNMLTTSLSPVFSSNNYKFAQTTEWETITLSTPFEYSGTKNLIVVVETNKATVASDFAYWCKRDVAATKAIRKYSTTDTSYSNAFSAQGMETSTFRPDIKLAFAKTITSSDNGTSASSNSIGLCPYYKYFSSQTIYTPKEVGAAGSIVKIAYYVDAPATETLDETFIVYMAETESDQLDKSTMLTQSDFKLAGMGTRKMPTTKGWSYMDLSIPFEYSGKKNLVVALCVSRNAYNSDNKYSYKTTSKGKSIIQKSDTNTDCSLPWNNAKMEFENTSVPIVRFSISRSAKSCYSEIGNFNSGYNNMAFAPCESKTASQTLYLKEDIPSGMITKLSFKTRGRTRAMSSKVKIYIGQTDKTTLTPTDKLSSSDMTLVFDSIINIGKESFSWEDVVLKNPYNYLRFRNLVIAISTEKDETSIENYYCSTTSSSKTVLSKSTTDPFGDSSLFSQCSYSPDIRFTYEHQCNHYTDAGFGICDKCGMRQMDVFEAPANITSNYYGVSKVGHLMWIAQQNNLGKITSNGYYNIMNDIDLTGYDWVPIGTDSNPMKNVWLRGGRYNSNEGHTITGIPANSYLVGTLGSGGSVRSVRMTSGTIVKMGKSGSMTQCLTLGSALVESNSGTTVQNSYYLSNTESSNGGRTLAQMQSGQVTYELNASSYSNFKTTWYQTIETDSYPLTDNTRSKVYRFTECSGNYAYTNEASKSNTTVPHTLTNNTLCSVCGGQPTTLSADVELVRTKAYARTVQAQMASGKKLTYKRTYGNSDVNQWQSFYVPFAMQYTDAYSKQFDIAEIQDFGIFEDTYKDGMLDTKDEKKLAASYLEVGSITKPNTAYLIRPKTNSTITFVSYDGKVYPNTLNSIELSTMKDKVVITPTYTPVTTSGAQKQLEGGALKSSTSTLYTFSWYATPSYRNGNTWDQNTINIYAHRFGWTELVDNESNTYTQASEQIVDNLRYERAFVDRQAHNWQAMYLPFDVVVEESGDDVYPKYAVIESVTTEGAVDYINVHKCVAGDTISANTPALVCVDRAQTLTYEYSLTTLKPAISTKKILESDRASYTFTGVYAPYQSTSTWYAIAKGDGTFHKAGSGAKLPPYRFYMTYKAKVNSAELRFAFRGLDEESETGITDVSADEDEEMIFTLDGRRAQEESLQPGIYVKNGKKVRIQ